MMLGFTARGAELVSGQPLKVGTEAGLGLLASPNAYKTMPVGAAHVSGGKRPDLFVYATHGLERGLYLYRWVRDLDDGVPVFAGPQPVKHPAFKDKTVPECVIRDGGGGVVHGYWLSGTTLTRTVYDAKSHEFKTDATLKIPGLPRPPNCLTVAGEGNDYLEFVVGCSNGVAYRPAGDEKSDDYVLYDGTGAFRGQWPRTGLYRFRVKKDFSGVVEPPTLFSQSAEEILSGVNLTAVRHARGADSAATIIAGASLGNLYAFAAGKDGRAAPKQMLFGPDGRAIRHETIDNVPIAYPNAAGELVDLVIGGEGALYYYACTGRTTADGHPVYDTAREVRLEQAELYAGTLCVPNVVDWDGDGALDLIVGNSEGRVLFFKNHGSSREPAFGIGQRLEANGISIHVQPGYYGIQGPFETRWGYSSPTVADWNQDGLPDILLSSATARHEVYLNIGTRTTPRLAAPRPLYCDGLELHGMWRVKPGVSLFDGVMSYIMQDDANALHLYRHIDDFNLADEGPLLLTSGAPITSHPPAKDSAPGQKGRSKIEVVDWDGDGLLDLLVGTAKRGAVPEPERGLPWARQRWKILGLQVLFLRNTGSNRSPRYEAPRQLQFKGRDLYLGAHEMTAVACGLGDTSKGPNLLIGMESGRIWFFRHEDITFFTPPAEAAKP